MPRGGYRGGVRPKLERTRKMFSAKYHPEEWAIVNEFGRLIKKGGLSIERAAEILKTVKTELQN